MTSATAPEAVPSREPALQPLRPLPLVLLCLVLTISLIPVFFFMRGAAVEVSKYQASSFDAYAREALAAEDYAKALEIATGALKSGFDRTDHWGRAHLIRAQAHLGLNQLEDALHELDEAVFFWAERYYFATEEDRRTLLQTGDAAAQRILPSDPASALAAFSAAAMGSADPVAYLESLANTLAAEDKLRLWPAEPYLVLQDFNPKDGAQLRVMVEEQGRKMGEQKMVDTPTGRGVTFSLSQSTGAGRSVVAVPVYVPLTDRSFQIRVRLKAPAPPLQGMLLSFWFDNDQRSAAALYRQGETLSDGWQVYTSHGDIYQERLAEAERGGYDVTGGILNSVGLEFEPGAAADVVLDRLELVLSAAG